MSLDKQRAAYLILIERVGVDVMSFATTSCRWSWSSSREAALSFSLRTFVIDASTRWHIYRDRRRRDGKRPVRKGELGIRVGGCELTLL